MGLIEILMKFGMESNMNTNTNMIMNSYTNINMNMNIYYIESNFNSNK